MAFGCRPSEGWPYTQNVKTLDEYYDALDRDDLPVCVVSNSLRTTCCDAP